MLKEMTDRRIEAIRVILNSIDKTDEPDEIIPTADINACIRCAIFMVNQTTGADFDADAMNRIITRFCEAVAEELKWAVQKN